jgi:hypothetical protein
MDPSTLIRVTLLCLYAVAIPTGERGEARGETDFVVANPRLRDELIRRAEEDQAIAQEYYPKEATGRLDSGLIARRSKSLADNTARSN